ncbi:MAG: 3-oxoacid CoA-transferase subunit A [Candidatus Izimaplasma sp.]|nr:3-oxoacid CoA-transferase subunit A [Candidatus Izimaplasma bacterium]
MKEIIKITDLKNHLFDGMSIMVGGFMAVGTPELLIDEIVRLNIKNITIICNDAGFIDLGVGKLIVNGQVKKLIASHIGLNPEAGRLMSEGLMECELVPQGTLAEQIRAGGAGLGGFLTPTGLGTVVEKGKEIITVNKKDFLLELPLRADLALLYGTTVDKYGNTNYTKTTRNFNPVMATATDVVIVQAREMVDKIDPDNVMTPHIFVDYIVKEEE